MLTMTKIFAQPAKEIQKQFALPYTPGEQQVALLLATAERLESGKKVALFPGAAGTGKTTTLKVLLAALEAAGKSVTVAAPTHKAAGRASECLDGRSVTTVHRVTYAGAQEVIEEDEEFASELDFNTREAGSAEVGNVLVIDEASMVGERVGMDLMAALPAATQIIAVGDGHQLPPVNELGYFALLQAEVQLTDVFRQEEGSPVLRAATTLRETGFPMTFSSLHPHWRDGQNICTSAGVSMAWNSIGQAAMRYAGAFRRTGGDVAAICGVNVTRVKLNDAIRAQLGFSGREHGPAAGERLVCRAGGNGLSTSEIVSVVETKPYNFGDFGRGWFCTVQKEGGFKMTVALLDSVWNYHGSNLQDLKNRGLVGKTLRRDLERGLGAEAGLVSKVDVTARCEAYRASKGKAPSQWLVSRWEGEQLLELGAFATFLTRFQVQVDTGYAITCHAAQGSQYHTVYVIADCVDFMARGDFSSPADLYRWGYTALTRAVAQCYIVGKSKHGGW